RVMPSAPRVRGGAVIVAGIALAVGLGAGWALWGTTRAVSGTAASALTRVQVTFTGHAGEPALSPAGDLLAYIERRCEQAGESGFAGYQTVTALATRCRDDVMVQDTGTSTPVGVLRGVPYVMGVRFTSRATSLVISGQLDTLTSGTYVIPRLGGAPRRIGAMGYIDVHATGDTAIILPGSRELGNARTALIVQIATGQVIDSVRMPSGRITAISWSPDGQTAAVTNGGDRLYLVDRKTGRGDSLAIGTRHRLRWLPDGSALLFYQPAAGRDDDFMRVAVTRDGRFDGRPVTIAPRSPTIYRGHFDVARTSGLIALVSGSAVQDIHSFELGSNGMSRQVTSGTSWYGLPSISPDGKATYYLRGNGDGDNLFRARLDTTAGSEEAITTGSGAGVGALSPMSPNSDRLIFQRSEGDDPLRTYDVDVRARTATRRSVGEDGSWMEGIQPFGDVGAVGLSADGRALLIVDRADNQVRRLPMPDSIQAITFVLGPAAKEVALQLRTPGETLIAVTPLDRWAPRVLQRLPGVPLQTSLSWRADGFIYYGTWDSTRGVPVLRRLDANGTAAQQAETVMSLPLGCSLKVVVIATNAPRGVCLMNDFRGDVYLWRLDGVTR
ncbi:MAG TPA: hypothetical protein VE869_04925, partial [Gemmatimonas sp.]|nr:hypothetical protein [Gemmatimonas sp.]